MIDEALLNELREKLKRAADWEYFFEHLQSPEWASPLLKAGFFGDPPPLVREGGFVQVPGWPPSAYLARVAAKDPQNIASLVSRIPETDNVRVQRDLIKAIVPAPPESVKPLIPKVAAWLHGPLADRMLPHEATDLIVAMAQRGATTLTTKLLLLWLNEPSGEPGDSSGPAAIEEWWYGQALDRAVPVLREADPAGTLQVLVTLLAAVQAQALGTDPEDHAVDYSTFWRPAIEDNDQNNVPSNKSALLVYVRDTAHALGAQGCSQLEGTLRVLAQGRWQVFERLSIDVARSHGTGCPGVVARFLLRKDLFDNPETFHEYAVMVRERFGDLTEDERGHVIRWVREGPDITKLREALAERSEGAAASETEIETYVEDWKARRYELLAAWLPPGDKAEYERLTAGHDEPAHPDFLQWTTGVMTGPTSPLTQDEVLALSLGDLSQFLQEWEPESGFMLPTREGLGRVVASAISARPKSFLSKVDVFKNLNPTYVRAFFEGVRQILGTRDGYTLSREEWEAVLGLARWLVEQPIGDAAADSFEADVSWEHARLVIAHVVDEAINKQLVPEELAHQVWSVIQPLMKDPQPTPEVEARLGPPSMDPGSLAINSVRGLAMHAAFSYVAWRAKVAAGDTATTDEVLGHLTRRLAPASEPSLAVRSVFGYWFPAMAEHYRPWADAHVGDVFPLEPDQYLLFRAAWDAYLARWAPGTRELEMLRGQYELAVARLGEDRGEQRKGGSLSTTDELVGHHLAWLYCGGTLSLDDPLLITFFERAPREVTASATEYLGRLFRETAPPAWILQRLKAWWASRREALLSVKDKSELGKLGWWARVADADADWFLTEVENCLRVGVKLESDFYLVKELAKLAASAPSQVFTCLSLMEESGNYSWLISGHADEVSVILTSALASGNDELARKAGAFIGVLAAKGEPDFGALLGAGSA